MKSLPFIISLFVVNVQLTTAQNEIVTLTPDMFVGDQLILLGTQDGWMFKPGRDSSGLHDASVQYGWIKLKPFDLSAEMADADGRLEGWFSINFKLDPSFGSTPLKVGFGTWSAVDVYLDNIYIGSLGSTGDPFEEVNPFRRDLIPLNIKPSKVYNFTFYFVDYISTFPMKDLRGGEFAHRYFVHFTGPRYQERVDSSRLWDYLEASWASINGATFFILLIVALFNRNETNLPLILANTGLYFLAALLNIPRFQSSLTFSEQNTVEFFVLLIYPFNILAGLILTSRIFRFKLTPILKLLIVVPFAAGLLNVFLRLDLIQTILALVILVIGAYMIIKSWSTLHGAQWAVVVGILISIVTFIWYGIVLVSGSVSLAMDILLVTIVFISPPLSLAFYVAIRFSEMLKQIRRHADEVVKVSVEKEKILASQKEVLEQQVKDRTSDLTQSIEKLKSTQAQLVQSEKMASLGELTAGIAHEIQNPLNFVNNFSEVNTELIDDLKKELASGNSKVAAEIADAIKENEQKINHHGKRADGIVKSMLQHSRSGSSNKELVDINAICEEYLRLSYHGYRAKDKSFNANYETNLDASCPKLNLVRQDIGRVLLNLTNNAFYSVTQKARQNLQGYEPKVSVSTKRLADKIEIRVKDNGVGIPEAMKRKIFHPFFTTKPPGQGTGLGLSLAFDIITKTHGGELRVASQEGIGCEFIIVLPQSKSS